LIPPSFIQDLLSRVDIVDLVGRYVPLKKGGANLMGLCPFHNEKSPSFTVSPGKQFYHCFGCGAHGSAIGFLIEYSGLGFVEAVKELAQGVGMVVPEDDSRLPPAQRAEYQAKSVALSEVMQRACDFYRNQLRQQERAKQYLIGRGMSGEIALRYGIGYAPDGAGGLRSVFADYTLPALVEAGLVIERSDDEGGHGKRYDRFRDRIMFPIRNHRGQVVGFGGRVLDHGEPKYLNSPETPLFQKGNELYGLFEARQAIRAAGYVLVTEGYMDVVALAQLGFPQVVATLGTACTAVHVQKLLRQTDRVVFSFDGDRAGRGAARRALEACLPHATDNKLISFLFLPAEHDPDSYVRTLGADAFQQEIANAVPLSRFLLTEITGHCDLASAEGRARAQFDAKPLLQLLPAAGLRAQIVRDLARLTESSAAEIEALCEIKAVPVARRSAPLRSVRPAPVGLERQAMRLLLACPQLLRDVDGAALQAAGYSSTDGSMLSQLVAAIGNLNEQPGFAALVEYLQQENSDFDTLAAEVSAAAAVDPEIARLELAATLRQMEMEKLTTEMNQLARSDMQLEEIRTRYQQLMARQQVLRQQAAAARGAP
jgi:DNA primase